jgi:RNA polymerase sigma-70 factor (ECF subfamily)
VKPEGEISLTVTVWTMLEIPSNLLLGCLNGDDASWQELIRLTGGHLQRIARTNLRDPAMAEDVMQETYFKVFRNLHRLRDRSRVMPWMIQILVNECRMLNRKTKHEAGDESEESFSYTLASTKDRRGKAETREILNRLLAKMPELYREVLILREIEDMDYTEIASALKVPVGTVRSRLARARAMWTELAGKVIEDGHLLDLCLEGGDGVA